jgi:hypothetical protein
VVLNQCIQHKKGRPVSADRRVLYSLPGALSGALVGIVIFHLGLGPWAFMGPQEYLREFMDTVELVGGGAVVGILAGALVEKKTRRGDDAVT